MASEYWSRRAEENDKRNETSKEAGIQKVRNAFEAAEETILARIDAYHRKYAEEGTISPADGKVRLTPSELTSFRKQISKLSKEASTDEEKARLEQLKRRVYISRQEALLAEIRHHVVELGGKTESAIGETLQKIYSEQESRQHYNIEQDLGYGVNFEGLSPSQIQSLIHQGYSEDDFSKTVWRNNAKLVKNLDILIPQMFILGRSVQDLARELSKRMNTPRNYAETTIRTEGSNVAAQADMHTYGNIGIETYEFFATLDSRTSAECAALDGTHHAVKDAQAGVNLPPMHANCRSTTLPDVDMEGIDEERLAKDKDGNYVVVPKQSYNAWKRNITGRWPVQYPMVNPIALADTRKRMQKYYDKIDEEAVVKKMKEYIDSAYPSIQLTAEDLQGVIDSGTFKTLFETGKSGGWYNPEYRQAADEYLFGISPNQKASEHPISGFLANKLTDADFTARTYGDIRVEFSKEIYNRTTVTFGDSLDGFKMKEYVPTWINDPKIESVKYPERAPSWEDITDVPGYIEIQVHGGLSMDDVVAIHFTEETFLARELADLGYEVYIDLPKLPRRN